MSISAINYIR